MADFHETLNMYANLSATPLNVSICNQQQLNKISETKYYFVAEIKERINE